MFTVQLIKMESHYLAGVSVLSERERERERERGGGGGGGGGRRRRREREGIMDHNTSVQQSTACKFLSPLAMNELAKPFTCGFLYTEL